MLPKRAMPPPKSVFAEVWTGAPNGVAANQITRQVTQK
jgi:hypothetical protein